MKKLLLFYPLLFISFSILAGEREVVIHSNHNNHGLDQIYVEPPSVTYDDELNELTVL